MDRREEGDLPGWGQGEHEGDAGGSAGCWRFREAASAQLDGEDPGLSAVEVDRHLGSCASCRRWVSCADLAPGHPAPFPDLTARVMVAVGLGVGGVAGPSDLAPRRGRLASPGPVRRRSRALRTAALVTAVVAVAGGIGAGAATLLRRGAAGGGLVSTRQVQGSSQSDRRYPGATVLPVALPKPDLVLTDTAGRPFDLTARTAGRVTLLYFGYTHCPDVCPINMALAAQALARMPAAEATEVDVVFVSTDPKRDTPSAVKAWLGNFSPRFVGLTGDIGAVERAETSVGMARSVAEPGGPMAAGGYQVVHSGFTLVYDQTGTSHLQFFDTAHPIQYATTLEHLVQSGFQA